MVLEQRDGIVQSETREPTRDGRSDVDQTKSFVISKREVVEAYKRVKANKGGSGCDGQSIKDFELNFKDNLYKLWNRMSSGRYIPPPVQRVEIIKSDGGIRPLGIPTVSDRIAQMIVKQRVEPMLEKHFHPDSYGYRPSKSALEALGVTRQRCWNRAWVLDMDIKGFFGTINHDLLMLVVSKHIEEKWMRLYIERWLKAPVQYTDGRLEKQNVGTPQGGVISPLLANLFLHYVFDVWVEKRWQGIQFERYADDIVCHCVSEREAVKLKEILTKRFTACGLTLHPTKTKIAYCKSSQFQQEYGVVSFDFLGHTFKPKLIKTRSGVFRVGFLPSISRHSAMKIRKAIKDWDVFKTNQADLMSIAKGKRTTLLGWINYYGKYGRAGILCTLHYLNSELVRWAKRKYKRLSSKRNARYWFYGIRKCEPTLFVHWVFANKTMVG